MTEPLLEMRKFPIIYCNTETSIHPTVTREEIEVKLIEFGRMFSNLPPKHDDNFSVFLTKASQKIIEIASKSKYITLIMYKNSILGLWLATNEGVDNPKFELIASAYEFTSDDVWFPPPEIAYLKKVNPSKFARDYIIPALEHNNKVLEGQIAENKKR